jgi:hypothetical protein
MKDNLEKRMYFFVPYNISEIQKGIQAGHAALEYAEEYKNNLEYIDFISNWKTWIILNGGTSNSSTESIAEKEIIGATFIPKGSLDKILRELKIHDIKCSYFREPDLNEALTAVCFIADERVFNFEDYPDLDLFSKKFMDSGRWFDYFRNGYWDYDTYRKENPKIFSLWEKSLGGEDNAFLRSLIKNKKLA